MKVTIIMTQFVQTDAQSFKSVVQGLTGRDSTAAAPASTPPLPGKSFFNGGEKAVLPRKEVSHGEGGGQLEEIERWFLELPSFGDEFLSFCVE